MAGVPGEGESFGKEAADLRKVGRQPWTTGGTFYLKKHCYFVILPDKSCCKILNKYLLLKLRDRKGVISVEVEGDNGIDSLEHLSQHPYGQDGLTIGSINAYGGNQTCTCKAVAELCREVG